MNETQKIKQEIIELCNTHSFEYESTRDLLAVYLDALIEGAKVEQMQKIHDKLGIKNK